MKKTVQAFVVLDQRGVVYAETVKPGRYGVYHGGGRSVVSQDTKTVPCEITYDDGTEPPAEAAQAQ